MAEINGPFVWVELTGFWLRSGVFTFDGPYTVPAFFYINLLLLFLFICSFSAQKEKKEISSLILSLQHSFPLSQKSSLLRSRNGFLVLIKQHFFFISFHCQP